MRTFVEFFHSKDFRKKLIGQFGKYRVFVVDGEAVRNSSKPAEEFGGSGDHAFYPRVIPPNEIWIEDDVKPAERDVLMAMELYMMKHIEDGASVDKAYKLGLAKEKDYRASLKLSKHNPSKTDKKAHPKVYLSKYGVIKDQNITVWHVSGQEVRNRYKIDFIEGAQPWVYSWCPDDEIWLEDGLHDHEEPYVLLHEFTEMMLMKYRHLGYDAAHKIAAKVEFDMRGRRFTKADSLSLTKQKVFTLC